MQEFVIVNENEKELISRALELGWDSIVLLYKYSKDLVLPKISSDFVKVGVFLDKEILNKDFSGFEFVVALGTRFSKLPKGVTHVIFNEFEDEKDFIHQRRSGLNHVFLKDYKGKILIGYNIHPNRQTAVIGRMMQNVKLCKKFKVEISLCSLTSGSINLRHVGDVNAFMRVLEKNNF
jgi:RNase P/RNase MRP subunit p30